MALSPSRANVLIAGVSLWKVKDVTDADPAYHSLPFLRMGKITIDSLSTLNNLGQPVVYGYELKGSCQFPAIRTEANFVKLMDTLASKLIDHKITLINGQIIASAATGQSPTGFGLDFSIISDKDMDGDMYAEMNVHRLLTPTEYTNIMTSANAPADGSPSGDVLLLLDSLVRTDIVPAGISSIVLNGTDTISNLNTAKFKLSQLSAKDSRGQQMGYGWKLELDLEAMETKEVENLKWPAIVTRTNSLVVNFINGMIATFSSVGVTQGYATEKDSDGIAVLKIKCVTIITNASGVLDGVWS